MKAPINIRKLLIAVEASEYSETAADYGFGVAALLGAEVALVHVNEFPVMVQPYGGDMLMNDTPPIILPEVLQAEEDAGKALLKRMSESHTSNLPVVLFSRVGNTRDEILAVAEEWEADVIVLGTHGRTGFDHFISGSVAESVVRHSKCPVLVIPNA